ncbi:MAG: type II CRISPR-associated endonuclease Cas1 [Treponema sp.]|uniref:type II CRISPR-associated endonuclease Cas1 n=1 Tax=Treponema sp. TaxID=166 RepID=UPI00298E17FB|nr:type II CRISPR-associated endonuclease Cas1 [Treponema sp.]MCR5386364.1 type II CRISPR-associated endonuclease Cas1 [Treponema sp.]
MLNRVLEIAEENRYLSLKRGFIVIQQGTTELGSVPLDDIAVLLLSAQGITITKNVLNALSEKGCITVFCGQNYIPLSMVVPIASHTYFTKIIKTQINASEPFKKRVWQQIVNQKIKNQALSLKYCNKEPDAKLIEKIASLVKSGDPDNREAYAARMYWKFLFGDSFIRDKNGDGINSLLNYGYAIMRACMARAICAHGLIPSLGIHHDNNLNQFCLADDLFEIYRPIVDTLVYKLIEQNQTELTPEIKKALVNLLKIKVKTSEGESQVVQSMHYVTSSFVNALEDGKPNIELPVWEGNENGITIIE